MAEMAEAERRPKIKVKKKNTRRNVSPLNEQDIPSPPTLDELGVSDVASGVKGQAAEDSSTTESNPPAHSADLSREAGGDNIGNADDNNDSETVTTAVDDDEQPDSAEIGAKSEAGVDRNETSADCAGGNADPGCVRPDTDSRRSADAAAVEGSDGTRDVLATEAKTDAAVVSEIALELPPTAPTETQAIVYSFPLSPTEEANAPALENERYELAQAAARLETEAASSREEKILIHRKKIKRLYPDLNRLVDDQPAMRPFAEDQILTLYENPFLRQKDAIVADFVDSNTEKQLEYHELYKLLSEYMRSRQNLISTTSTIATLREDVESLRSGIWDIVPDVVSGRGRCADNRKVKGEHYFNYGLYNEEVADKMSQCLQDVRKITKEKYALHVHNAEVLRLQIDYYIHMVLDVPLFADMPKNTPVSNGMRGRPSQDDADAVVAVRSCISVLFLFLRKPLKDEKFLKDVQSWLKTMAAFLLRVAFLQDHLFLLNHVLRCPPGIYKWATSLVQIPPPSPWSPYTDWPVAFDSLLLDYAIAALATMLLPVEARSEYLEQVRSALLESSFQDPWVFLDSEGEEDEEPENSMLNWRENDVVALLNQVPFASIFQHLLFVTQQNDEYSYEVVRTTEQGLLKLISVASHLVNILHAGLKTYNQSRYKQLTKRICRLIRHTVQYVSDHWLNFRSAENVKDQAMLLRLQVEYDQFFLRAVNCIFYSQSLGAWQFMAILPYTCVSTVMMWQLLWLLHNNYQDKIELVDLSPSEVCNKLQDKSRKLCFEEKLNDMPQSEVYFLMTSFSNMAASRGEDGRALTHVIASEIFEISYVNRNLRQLFAKEGRDLLCSLAHKHPFIISVLLDEIDDHMMEVGNMACYLMQSMPLQLWVPDKQDLDIISHFLLYYPLDSPQSQLARLLIQNLNYGFNNKQETFLDQSTHRQLGLLLLEAYEKLYVPFEASGYVYKQVKYFSYIATATKESSTPAGFVAWMWEMLLQLRLHIFDCQHPLQLEFIVSDNPPAELIPDIQKCDWLHPVLQANKNLRPPSLFLSVSIGTVGHYREEVLDSGLKLISTLVLNEQYSAAIHCVSHVLPLFYLKPEMLTSNKRFLTDLQYLLLADNTYLAMAKSIVMSEFPGCILKQLAVVIVGHVEQAAQWSPDFVSLPIKLWIALLFRLPDIPIHKGALANKAKGRESVMYLLDVLVQLAYLEAKCFDSLLTAFAESLTQFVPMTKSNSVVKSVFSYVLGNQTLSWPALVPLQAAPSFPWFAWAGMLAEAQIPHVREMWMALLKEMAEYPKLTPDAALKKASANLKMSPPSVDVLLLYRWAQQALQTDVEHPALPLIWQQFFLLYLQRFPVPNTGSAGQRFFESATHFSLLKKLKRRLNELADHFFLKQSRLSQSLHELPDLQDAKGKTAAVVTQLKDSAELVQKLLKMYRTFCLWLEEPRLHNANIVLTALPPQYYPEALGVLLQGSGDLWHDLVHVDVARESLKALLPKYHAKSSTCKNAAPRTLEANSMPEELILKRLRSYEGPMPAPAIPSLQRVIPAVSTDMFRVPNQMMTLLSSQLKVLTGQARMFNAQAVKLASLDSAYMEWIPNLYQNVPTYTVLTIPCDYQENCKGRLHLRLQYAEARLAQDVAKVTEQNRSEWMGLLMDLQRAPSRTACSAVVHLEACITQLVQTHRCGATDAKMLQALGSEIFFELVRTLNKETTDYFPARQFLTSCLDMLGQEFVSGHEDQCLPVLKVILKDPSLVGHVAPFFAPAAVNNEQFVLMYHTVTSCIAPAFYNAVFVLLTKFDLPRWLHSQNVAFTTRTKLLESIEKAFAKFGLSPEREVLPLLELYHTHLHSLLLFRFPEHFGSILAMLLKGVDFCSVPAATWFVFLQGLGFSAPPEKLARIEQLGYMEQYARQQCLLSASQIAETLEVLTKHFRNLRNSDHATSKNGLYSKVQPYLVPVSMFLEMMAHCFLWEKLKGVDNELPGAMQRVLELYSPWLELTDGKKILVPWTMTLDSREVAFMLDAFTNLLSFFHKNCHGVRVFSVLSEVWRRYFISYVWTSAPDYITSVLQTALGKLPWSQFMPSLEDLKLAHKLLEAKYAGHLTFLLMVFKQVPWQRTLNCICEREPENVQEFYSLFAELFVNLAWHPDMVQDNFVPSLIPILIALDWSFLQPELVSKLQDVFASGCSPTRVLKQSPGRETDHVMLEFISCLSCMTSTESRIKQDLTTTLRKQQAFIGMLVKLCNQAMETTPSLLRHYSKEVQQALPKLMDQCRIIIDVQSELRYVQSEALVSKALSLISITTDPTVQDALLEGLLLWVQECSGDLFLLPLLHCACGNLASVSHMVKVTEACIASYCSPVCGTLPADGGWAHVLSSFRVPELTLSDFFLSCSQHSAYLTQFCYLLYCLPRCRCLADERVLLGRLAEWISQSCPSGEDAEPKLLLLWEKVISLSIRQLDFDDDNSSRSVYKTLEDFCSTLAVLGEDKVTGGLLGAFGLGKKSAVSVRFRFCCRVMGAFVASQMTETGTVRLAPIQSDERPSVTSVQALAKLKALQGNRMYASLTREVEQALQMVQDPNRTIRDSISVIQMLVNLFYSDKVYLRILFFGVM
ncbi:ectopic P granules protein 5 homolog [Ixodes scapularis]|uniref:ectopic P granules protein 5 homolog n=1 Tax=Ixodes scapularis TaxID=6945 RepID=UPI001A9F3E84|nr:ectopic P granules protein 5 homolog [Ixodes scapularis]